MAAGWSAGWSAEETQALIEVWGDANVQSQPFFFTTGAYGASLAVSGW